MVINKDSLKDLRIQEVVLVDQNDRSLGTMEKLEAHQKGLLHRAFSVFVFNSKAELMLQKRALGKYHSEGLWTNTCCSHPSPGETTEAAANRRLKEEMGFSCNLSLSFSFIYNVELERGLSEHELDHVLIGVSDHIPEVNTAEVSEVKWMTLAEIQSDIQRTPENYTSWFKIIINDYFAELSKALTIF